MQVLFPILKLNDEKETKDFHAFRMATPACKEEISKEWLQVILTQYESRSKPKTSVAVTSFEVNPGELLSSVGLRREKTCN